MPDKELDISSLFDGKEPSKESPADGGENAGKPSKSSGARRQFKGRYLILALLLVAAGVYVGYRNLKSVSITKVAVEGTYFVNPANVIGQVHIKKGINPDSLDFLKIIKSVEQLPYVRQAFVRIVPPHELMIRVAERQPVAMLIDGDNKMYVDTAGVKLPIIEGKSRDVPLVYGFSATGAGDTLKSDSFKSIVAFLKVAVKYPLAKATISEIVYTPDDGVVALSQPGGVKLIFGKGDFDRKFTYWEAFYRQVIPGKGMDHLRSVDLRFRNQIVTRETGT